MEFKNYFFKLNCRILAFMLIMQSSNCKIFGMEDPTNNLNLMSKVKNYFKNQESEAGTGKVRKINFPGDIATSNFNKLHFILSDGKIINSKDVINTKLKDYRLIKFYNMPAFLAENKDKFEIPGAPTGNLTIKIILNFYLDIKSKANKKWQQLDNDSHFNEKMQEFNKKISYDNKKLLEIKAEHLAQRTGIDYNSAKYSIVHMEVVDYAMESDGFFDFLFSDRLFDYTDAKLLEQKADNFAKLLNQIINLAINNPDKIRESNTFVMAIDNRNFLDKNCENYSSSDLLSLSKIENQGAWCDFKYIPDLENAPCAKNFDKNIDYFIDIFKTACSDEKNVNYEKLKQYLEGDRVPLKYIPDVVDNIKIYLECNIDEKKIIGIIADKQKISLNDQKLLDEISEIIIERRKQISKSKKQTKKCTIF